MGFNFSLSKEDSLSDEESLSEDDEELLESVFSFAGSSAVFPSVLNRADLSSLSRGWSSSLFSLSDESESLLLLSEEEDAEEDDDDDDEEEDDEDEDTSSLFSASLSLMLTSCFCCASLSEESESLSDSLVLELLLSSRTAVCSHIHLPLHGAAKMAAQCLSSSSLFKALAALLYPCFSRNSSIATDCCTIRLSSFTILPLLTSILQDEAIMETAFPLERPEDQRKRLVRRKCCSCLPGLPRVGRFCGSCGRSRASVSSLITLWRWWMVEKERSA